MIKLFRNIRKNLINEGKTTKYFKYAIGEIFLVVIGILIALSINNWNEKRQSQSKINLLLIEVLKDLETDILEIEVALNLTKGIDSISKSILQVDYKENGLSTSSSISDFFSFNRPFYQTQNGYENLINTIDKVPENYKSIIKNLRPLYSTETNKLNTDIGSINALIKDIENYYILNTSWYSNDLQGVLNDELRIEYIQSNPTFKNFVALYQEKINKYRLQLAITKQLAILNYANIYVLIKHDIQKPDFMPVNELQLSDEELSDFEGCYSTNGIVTQVSKQNGFLLFGSKAQNHIILVSNKSGNFEFSNMDDAMVKKDNNPEMIFERNEAGKVVSMTVDGGSFTVEYKKIEGCK
jgi:hypothetical protein